MAGERAREAVSRFEPVSKRALEHARAEEIEPEAQEVWAATLNAAEAVFTAAASAAAAQLNAASAAELSELDRYVETFAVITVADALLDGDEEFSKEDFLDMIKKLKKLAPKKWRKLIDDLIAVIEDIQDLMKKTVVV